MRTKNSKPLTARERAHLMAVKGCSECDRPAVARGLCNTHYMRLRRAGLLVSIVETDDEFISNRIRIDEDGHWLWQRSTRNGYGSVTRNGVKKPAHVFSFILHGGQLGDGLQVNHKCHVRECVNPDHLYAGTQKENMRDMRDAGRSNILRGTKNGMSKIDKTTALHIRAATGPAKPIAAKYGVSISLVYAIRKGVVWRHA